MRDTYNNLSLVLVVYSYIDGCQSISDIADVKLSGPMPRDEKQLDWHLLWRMLQ